MSSPYFLQLFRYSNAISNAFNNLGSG